MGTLEHCLVCNEPTGRAGRGEDSLYLGDVGPLCEACHSGAVDDIEANAYDAAIGALDKLTEYSGYLVPADVYAAIEQLKGAT